MFYAESWLLTQFLMAGDVPAYTARFGRFTQLLREGHFAEPAFTNALQNHAAGDGGAIAPLPPSRIRLPIPLILSTNVASFKPPVFSAPDPP